MRLIVRVIQRLVATSILLVLVACTQIATSAFPERVSSGKIEERYDKFEQLRSWELVPMTIGNSIYLPGQSKPGAELRMGLIVTAMEKPDSAHRIGLGATLLVEATASDWQFLKSSRAIIFLLNGQERIRLPTPDYDGNVGMGYVRETLLSRVSLDQINRILAADTVEMAIGLSEVKLRQAHVARIREFVLRVPSIAWKSSTR